MKVSEEKGGKWWGEGGGRWRYKYPEQEGESKMCHSPSSVCFSVLILHLKFTGRHGERWMDREREGGREQERDGGVCRCPLKGKEHLDSLSRKKKVDSCQLLRLTLSLSLSISIFLCIPYSRLHFNFPSVNFFLLPCWWLLLPFSYPYSRIWTGNVWSPTLAYINAESQTTLLKTATFDDFVEAVAGGYKWSIKEVL